MPRIRLDPAYDGILFPGWAAQPGLRTVEGVLTSALVTVLHESVRLAVTGRTNAGVRAAAQVAHLGVSPETWAALSGRSQRLPEAALLTRITGVLAREAQKNLACTSRGTGDVIATRAHTVSETFDSRFGALSHRYTYRIADATASRDPVQRTTTLWLPDVLDVEVIGVSARVLLGGHDFLSYCKPCGGATTIRTLCTLQWHRIKVRPNAGSESGLVTLSVVAGASCHSMVRSPIGAGLTVGQGRKPVIWPREPPDICIHQNAAPVAPPHGLALEEVIYPAGDELTAQAERTRIT